MDVSQREYSKQSEHWKRGYRDAINGREFSPTDGNFNKVGVESYAYSEYETGYLIGAS